MPLALFDLDNTLIAGDSDYSWGEFIVTKGLVDEKAYRATNEQFYQDYLNAELDAKAYQWFSLQPLKGIKPDMLSKLHAEFMSTVILPMWLPKAEALVEKHQLAGDTLVVITATNRFVVQPIVARFGVEHLICSEPEMNGAFFTGELLGVPCVAEGKVIKLQEWLKTFTADDDQNSLIASATFYSDSRNDLPLLNKVANPVAVDPDAYLRQVAKDKQWEIISLR